MMTANPSNITVTCIRIADDMLKCNGKEYKEFEEPISYQHAEFWIYLGVYVALVLFAGLMSGLTLGLLSLDMMTLKVMKDGGSPSERKYAESIMPLVARHHLLLVTLLLANAAAVETMPILLDHITSPVIAIVMSVTAVLIFGEVVPQALCSRYGLAIGAFFKPVVYLLMAIFVVIAWPISKLLDCLLGKDHTQLFRRNQLKVLVDIHADIDHRRTNEQGEALSTDEVLIIKGALDMKHKVVKDAMVPLDRVFMLEESEKLNAETVEKVLCAGHSRVPVYMEDRQNILGILLIKGLISLHPTETTQVGMILQQCSFRPLTNVDEDTPLFAVLNLFQTGKSHLAIVRKTAKDGEASLSQQPVLGIITLEDIMEQLLQEQIWDEADTFRQHIKSRLTVARANLARHQTCAGLARLPLERHDRPGLLRRSVSAMQSTSSDPFSPTRVDSDDPLLDAINNDIERRPLIY